MIGRIVVLIAGAGLASLAHAQEAAPPLELWNGFTTASTKAQIKEFKATWPKKRVEVIPGCPAEMGYRQSKGRMVTIIFLGQDREADCFNRLFAHYRELLGPPETDTTTFGSVIGFGNGSVLDTTSVGLINIWREGEKKTKLARSPGQGYNLIFTVREDKYIY